MGIGGVKTDSFRSRRESDLPMSSTSFPSGRGSSPGERVDIRGPSEVFARAMASSFFRTLHDRDLDIGFGGTHDTWSSGSARTWLRSSCATGAAACGSRFLRVVVRDLSNGRPRSPPLLGL